MDPASSRLTRSTRPSAAAASSCGRAEGMSLYSVQEGRGGPAKRLGKGPDRKMIVNLEYSPDGRYVLYSVHGPA